MRVQFPPSLTETCLPQHHLLKMTISFSPWLWHLSWESYGAPLLAPFWIPNSISIALVPLYPAAKYLVKLEIRETNIPILFLLLMIVGAIIYSTSAGMTKEGVDVNTKASFPYHQRAPFCTVWVFPQTIPASFPSNFPLCGPALRDALGSRKICLECCQWRNGFFLYLLLGDTKRIWPRRKDESFFGSCSNVSDDGHGWC